MPFHDASDLIVIVALILVGIPTVLSVGYMRKKGYTKTKAETLPYTIAAVLMGIVIWLVTDAPFLQGVVLIAILGVLVFVISFIRSKVITWLQDKIHGRR